MRSPPTLIESLFSGLVLFVQKRGLNKGGGIKVTSNFLNVWIRVFVEQIVMTRRRITGHLAGKSSTKNHTTHSVLHAKNLYYGPQARCEILLKHLKIYVYVYKLCFRIVTFYLFNEVGQLDDIGEVNINYLKV